VNVYEGKAGMVYLQVKLCDPERFEIIRSTNALYKYSFLSLPFLTAKVLKALKFQYKQEVKVI